LSAYNSRTGRAIVAKFSWQLQGAQEKFKVQKSPGSVLGRRAQLIISWRKLCINTCSANMAIGWQKRWGIGEVKKVGEGGGMGCVEKRVWGRRQKELGG